MTTVEFCKRMGLRVIDYQKIERYISRKYNFNGVAQDDIPKENIILTPEERIEAVNIIRRRVYALKGEVADNRVIRVISYDKRDC